MKTFTYKQSSNISSIEAMPIYDQFGIIVGYVSRVYKNRLTKVIDSFFDYRYFLHYVVKDSDNRTIFVIKKVIRRGKVWYEAEDKVTLEKYMITYENLRIGIPELHIKSNSLQMKIDKSMEGWSEFSVGGNIVARWQAQYDENEDLFHIILQIEELSPIQTPQFYIGISQATLFI